MINRLYDNDFLDRMLWGNSVTEYIDAILYFIIVVFILFFIQKIIMVRLERFATRTKTDIDDVIIEFIQSIRPRLYIVLSAYIALRTLALSEVVQNILNVLLIVIVIFQITRSIQIVIEYVTKKVSGTEEDEHTRSAAHLLSSIMMIIVWIFGILMILSNIGVNVTPLIAGAGIGGIAIAFAVKEILSDLFSSFAIYFDKPFKAGDSVKIDEDVGTIQKIGIKTTRVKSRTGEELIVSNQDMTSSRVHNFKRMDYRNVKTQFIVEFDTPSEKLEKIPIIIKKLVESVDNIEYKRAHLKSFGEWGLIFETLYQVQSRDYTDYMDAQQEVNFAIKKMLDDMSVVLAVPDRH